MHRIILAQAVWQKLHSITLMFAVIPHDSGKLSEIPGKIPRNFPTPPIHLRHDPDPPELQTHFPASFNLNMHTLSGKFPTTPFIQYAHTVYAYTCTAVSHSTKLGQ